MLQSVEEKFGKEGAVLLAVSTDGPETRSKIPEYVKKHNLRARVFHAEREEIPFDLRFVGSLFLLDREGIVAGVPSEFFASDMREVLEKKIPDLLAGKPAPGPLLLTLEKAPPGFGILWQRPLDFKVQTMAIAPASAGGKVEVGVLGDGKLRRYTPSGDFKDQVAMRGGMNRVRALYGEDLDGNGENEWMTGDANNFTLLTADGEIIGEQYGFRLRLLGFRDLDGDGVKEILLQAGGKVMAKRALPGLLWRTEGIKDLRTAKMDPSGAILAQTGDKICPVDRDGRLGRSCFRAPRGVGLLGSLATKDGRTLEAFGNLLEDELDLEHDLDGDGAQEILLARQGGILGFGLDGAVRLVLKVVESLQSLQFVAGDLDGRPGDELILDIPHYGLVALGRKSAGPDQAARDFPIPERGRPQGQ